MENRVNIIGLIVRCFFVREKLDGIQNLFFSQKILRKAEQIIILSDKSCRAFVRWINITNRRAGNAREIVIKVTGHEGRII